MSTREEDTIRFTPFWPLCLLTLSLAVFLGWQVVTGARQYIALLRLADQQTLLAGQAAQAESTLKALIIDVLELSKTDPEARAIVSKYNIKLNPATPSVPRRELALPEIKLLEELRDKADGSARSTTDDVPMRQEE